MDLSGLIGKLDLMYNAIISNRVNDRAERANLLHQLSTISKDLKEISELLKEDIQSRKCSNDHNTR